MHEVQQVGGGGAQSLDLPRIELVDLPQNRRVVVTPAAGVEKPAERELVFARLIDAGIRSFGFQRKAWSAPLNICRCSAMAPTTVWRDEPL